MPDLCFQMATRRGFRIDPSEKRVYDHVQGGHPRHTGIQAPSRVRPARLHYLLDLRDPALGIDSAPFQSLPLYWSRDYENGFKYRLCSDDSIEILSKPVKKVDRYSFLPELPKSTVTLRELHYDPTSFEDAYYFSGMFGVDHLDKRMRNRVIKQLHKDCSGDPPESLDELLYYTAPTPFMQGLPREACPNPDCPNHQFDECDGKSWQGIASLLFQIEPTVGQDPGVYDEIGGAEGGQLTFQVCKSCLSVCARNPSS